MPKNFLSLNEAAYILPDGHLLFENVSLAVSEGDKLALIGDNGAGKTTLLKIISGKAELSRGSLNVQAVLSKEVPAVDGSVADVLGVADILKALDKAEAGNTDSEVFEVIGSCWDIRARLESEFRSFGIEYVSLSDSFACLSGGEKEKILLAKIFLSDAQILLFDEPTNNLDEESRELFYNKISQTPKSVLLVSHDRNLLERMNAVAELSHEGIRRYGGNYSFYLDCKKQEQKILEDRKTALENEAGRILSTKSKLMEQVGKKSRYGEKMVANRKYSRIAGNAMKADAEVSVAKKIKVMNEKISKNKEELYDVGLALKDERIKVPLPSKPFIKEKLLELDTVSFGYGGNPLFENLNVILSGRSRVHIKGKNGKGKTTLIRLILGEIKPVSGTVRLNGSAVYLNQDLSLLKRDKSLLDNVIDFNPGITVNEAYAVLAKFQFKNTMALKRVETLSGGELLRASLAALLGTRKQPELLIFDEPTNSLDIKSVEILENALRQYQGALMVVSHDVSFVSNIRIDCHICL